MIESALGLSRRLLVTAALLAAPSTYALDLPALALTGAGAADILTTEVGLNGGCQEMNPLMQHRAARVGSKALVIPAVLLSRRALKRAGHPGWANVVLWSVATVWAGAAVWNIHEIRRMP